MEKRKVRIYKSHDGEGKYINKTKQFLEKAQMGMQMRNQNEDIQEQLQSVKYYIKGLKNETIDDIDILKLLISKGLRKDIASALIDQVNTEIEEDEAEQEEDNEEAETENQETAQSQMIPQQQEETEEEPDAALEHYNSYADEEYSNPNMEYQYGGLPSKKKFTSNVLKLLKKQEGGEEQQIGQGSRFETINNDANSQKSNFLNKIKEIASKSAVDDLYEKMIKSQDPELMQTAKKMAEERNKPATGTFEEAQSGGFIGGDNQPDMFMYGGTELPFYEADFLPEARYGYSVGNLRKAQKGDNGKLTEEELKQAKELGINDPGFSPDGTRQRINDARRNKWIDEQMQSKNNLTEKDTKRSKEKRTYIGVPYNARTREAYTDSFEGLDPYAKTVHKRGLFGRPKQWTEYYTKGKGPAKSLTPGQEIQAAYEKQLAEAPTKLKHGVEKELWDDLSGKAKRAIRRGERQLGREARRGADSMKEDAEFNKGVHARYKYDTEEDLARDLKRSEDAWDKDKSFVSDIDNSDNYPYKGKIYLTHDEKGERFDSPIIVAGPDLGYTEEDYDSKNMIDYEQKQLDEEALEEKTLYEQMMKDEAAAKEEMELDAEKQNYDNSKLNNDHYVTNPELLKLQNSEDSEIDYNNFKADQLQKLFDIKNEFSPKKMVDPQLSKLYQFIPGESNAQKFEKLQENLETDDQSSFKNQKFGFRYGGLPKAQTGPPVKKASDPTTNTTDLSGMLQPVKNSNTFASTTQSFPGMPSNVPVNPDAGKVKTVEMDPNQTKDQKITSLDFGNPSNDDIIAIDKERAPSNFDGEKAVNMFNAGATAVTGFMDRLDAAKKEKEMYENNFNSDNLYAASNTKDRGDYVDYGQQLGQFRYDQMGSDTSGRFAYGRTGGYMQEGGYAENDEVFMTDDELEDFLMNGGEVEYL